MKSSRYESIDAYNASQADGDRAICDVLRRAIDHHLPMGEGKIWHAHPVWFLAGNPTVGYSKLKGCIRLLFWSGQSFSAPGLAPEGTFKAAEARYRSVDDVDTDQLALWLAESRTVQWDYKSLMKKRRLDRLY